MEQELHNPRELYRVSGTVQKGFCGHIQYTTVFPKELNALQVCFTFDKREPQQDLDRLRSQCMAAVRENMPEGNLPPQVLDLLAQMPKGEINLSLFVQDACVGTAHRNLLTKAFTVSPSYASEGFLRCRPAGVIRLALHVLNVTNDDTQYTLTVRGGTV